MAIFLDDRYVLLKEREVRWLPKAYDGWDKSQDRAVTVGHFAVGDPPPILPGTLHLRHPNILGLFDLRFDAQGGLWAVYDHFGVAGADLLQELSASTPAVVWITHETTQALLYAREAGGRPGGFRLADFAPDQIRLFADGSVRVAGFGRIAEERDDAGEFTKLGSWAPDWVSHSSDSFAAGEDAATISGHVVSALTEFASADHNPHATGPRLIAALRDGLEGGEAELAAWLSTVGSADSTQALQDMLVDVGAQERGAQETIDTRPMVPDEAETEERVLPRVTIAPREPTPRPEAPTKTRKGLPLEANRRLRWILLGLLVLLIAVGGFWFRHFTGLDLPDSQVLLRTTPAGASVFLNDTLLLGKTPMPLDDLPVGWHRVRFVQSEFPPIEDSFLVYKSQPHRPFDFVFTRTLLIESRPAGAGVYLNGKRATRPTPFLERSWPVTQPLSLVMHMEQYGSIEDCILDPVYGTVEVRDPAAWSVETRGDTLLVRGLFVHTAAFFASPPDCRVTVDDTLAVDPTGGESYPLTFGNHKVHAEAVGFDPLDTTLVVSGQTPKIVSVVLSRPVRIYAYDPRQPDLDLRVLVDRLEGPDRTIFVRRFTPYSIRVPALAYTITLRKRDYRDTTVYVPPDLTAISVAMMPTSGGAPPREPRPGETPEIVEPNAPERRTPVPAGSPWVNIQVTAPGRQALGGAEVWARAAGAIDEMYLGSTDSKGGLRAQIPVGNYDLLAYLDAFSGVRKRVKVRSGRNRPIIIDLNR